MAFKLLLVNRHCFFLIRPSHLNIVSREMAVGGSPQTVSDYIIPKTHVEMAVTEKQELQQVVSGFLAGNSAQFRIVLLKITQFVYHQLSGTSAEKDEVVSEVLEILLENLRNDRFHGDNLKAFNVYTFSIVRHRVNRVLRRRSKLHYTDQPGEQVDHRLSPLEETSQRQLADKIMTALDPKCRQIIKLKFLLCWSDQEIADSLKKSKNATSTAITRCLNKAREFQFVKESM